MLFTEKTQTQTKQPIFSPDMSNMPAWLMPLYASNYDPAGIGAVTTLTADSHYTLEKRVWFYVLVFISAPILTSQCPHSLLEQRTSRACQAQLSPRFI